MGKAASYPVLCLSMLHEVISSTLLGRLCGTHKFPSFVDLYTFVALLIQYVHVTHVYYVCTYAGL